MVTGEQTEGIASSETVMQAIRDRRSVRRWQPQPVPREVLERILSAAIWAPSANNVQPWRFVVLQGERKQELGALLRRFVAEMQPGLNPVLWVHRYGIGRCAEMIEGSAATITAWATLAPEDRLVRLVSRGDLTPLFTWTMVVQSVAAAVQNLLLQAHVEGLGAVWMGYPNLASAAIRSWLQEEGELMATIALGYPAATPKPTPRKPLGAVVRWEGSDT